MGYVNDVGIAPVANQVQYTQDDFEIVASDIKASFTGKKLSLALKTAEPVLVTSKNNKEPVILKI